MMIDKRTTSILLLTSYFGKTSDRDLKPLSSSEWNRFVTWQRQGGIKPEDFLNNDSQSLLESFQDKTISRERIKRLLERKSGLALALEKWSKAGVWIINRGEDDYPKVLKSKLKELSPPLMFGIGNSKLLNNQFVGVVGSRKVSEEELSIAKSLGKRISEEGYGVVSGAAKGCDEMSMIGALENNGFSIGYVSDSLLRKSTSNVYRNHIIKGNLCLLSPYNPEAGFNIGNAMSRNKLIYAQSSATIVIKSDTKGGTWEGAKENIKKNWTPLWVIKSTQQGNQELSKLGGKTFLFHEDLSIKKMLNQSIIANKLDLFTSSIEIKNTNSRKLEKDKGEKANSNEITIRPDEYSFFDLFLVKFKYSFGTNAVTKKEIEDTLRLNKSQINEWLNMGIENKTIIKNSRPVRYQLSSND